MFYRVDMSLSFINEDEARDFYHDGELALPKASIINPYQVNEERGFIQLQKCYHDTDPTAPCLVEEEKQPPYPP